MAASVLQVVSSISPQAEAASLEALRRRVQALEQGGAAAGAAGHGALSFDVPEIDAALPWGGLALGAVHEIAGAAGEGAAFGFLSALLARHLARTPGALLWCRRRDALCEGGDLYAPGLAACGLDPARLIVLYARRDKDVLWAVREGLACRRLAAVVGEVEALDLTASRRLQLAAEASGVSGFLLRPRAAADEPSAAFSRWAVRAAPSGPVAGFEGVRGVGAGPARWWVDLVRCRGAEPGAWLVEWRHETGDFAVAAPLSDRSVVPAAARLAL